MLLIRTNTTDRKTGQFSVPHVFYFAYNQIKDWTEISKLNDLNLLEGVTAYGNPIHERIVGENFPPEPSQPVAPLEMYFPIETMRMINENCRIIFYLCRKKREKEKRA